MRREFDPGYPGVFGELVADHPDESVYLADDFRVEWGPIFHRGRLDGSARVLVIGQDPAAHEAIVRRILVGVAGQRAQGLLARLGITRSYVFVNAFLYSVYGQTRGAGHVDDPGIVQYRNRWLDAIVAEQQIEAVISLGQLADRAYRTWRRTPSGAANTARYVAVKHPTYPESASASGAVTLADASRKLCESWNRALVKLDGVVVPDEPVALRHYGDALTPDDLTAIPDADLPAGLPAWMGSVEPWATRTGDDADVKRATITVTVPAGSRAWIHG